MSERYKIFDYCCDMFRNNHCRGHKFTWCRGLSTWNISCEDMILFADIKCCPYCGKILVPWHGLIDLGPIEDGV